MTLTCLLFGLTMFIVGGMVAALGLSILIVGGGADDARS